MRLEVSNDLKNMPWPLYTRLRLVLSMASMGLIAGITLSWKLWTTNRNFPHFPVFDFFPPLSSPLDVLLLLGCLILALSLTFRPYAFMIIALVIAMIAMALQDQMRWQPWYYQYLLMLLPFAFLCPSKENQKAIVTILSIEKLIIVFIYIWGGIHKCHSGFIDVFQNSLLSPITENISSAPLVNLINSIAYLVPIIEILVGIGLLLNRTRNIALVFAILTHLVILTLLGPVKGSISNSVVWPWNIAMMGMVIVLFYKNDSISLQSMLTVTKLRIPIAIISFLVVIAPTTFYSGNWDRYLSFNLYSGWQKRLYVRIDSQIANTLPEHLQMQFLKSNTSDRHRVISVNRWASKELNVPMITEWRILRSFANRLAKYDSGNNEIVFYIDYRNRPDFPKRYYRCDETRKINRKEFFN